MWAHIVEFCMVLSAILLLAIVLIIGPKIDGIYKRIETVEYNSVLNTEQISACCSAMDSHAGDTGRHILFVEVLK